MAIGISVLTGILKRASQYNKLQRRYQILNSGVVAVGVLLAVPVWIGLAKWSRLALGLPVGSGSLDGVLLPFLAWLAFLLFITVFVWLVGIVLVAALSTLILMPLGKIRPSEVSKYVFRSQYPSSWYKSALQERD